MSCDFIEPLRPLIDSYVINGQANEDNYRSLFINMLSKEVFYNNQLIKLDNAIHLYVEDLLLYLKTGEVGRIKFIKYEL